MTVRGRVAVVAGAGESLGDAIARRLCEEGAVVVLGGKDARRVDTLVEELRKAGSKADGVAASPDEPASIAGLVEKAVLLHGKLDIAVDAWDRPAALTIEETDPQQLGQILATNLAAPVLLARAAAPHMRKQRYGRIVNLTSAQWLGLGTSAAYSSARAGVVGLGRTLAWELVAEGITVNTVGMGLIETDGPNGWPAEALDEQLKLQPIRRPGTPDEVAEAVLFFAADEGGYMTGQTLYVCGGRTAFSSLTA